MRGLHRLVILFEFEASTFIMIVIVVWQRVPVVACSSMLKALRSHLENLFYKLFVIFGMFVFITTLFQPV